MSYSGAYIAIPEVEKSSVYGAALAIPQAPGKNVIRGIVELWLNFII